MESEILVYADLQSEPLLVGRLWTRMRKDRESASFEYDKAWLEHPNRFSLDPALILGPGPYHAGSDQPMFGAIGDSAPDRWGRVLMRRFERRRAREANETPRTLREIDYLLMVDDEARPGALRFALKPGGPFLAATRETRIPPLLELPRLLSAADHVLSEEETADDLRLLLAPGSSLGGARPKASIRDRDGALAIAKFPQYSDRIEVVLWEALALTLAAKAGIEVPSWRLETIAGRPVLIVCRFDREGVRTRVPFLSAMSMLGARDNQMRSYLEIADALRRYGASPRQDMAGLWRRIVFNVLISNTDDHLRNHGFLYAGQAGWRLAPAYDLNPVPIDIKPRTLSTCIDIDNPAASLSLAFEVAAYFQLSHKQARSIASEVGASVARWRRQAARLGLSAAQCDRMSSAFEHPDLQSSQAR